MKENTVLFFHSIVFALVALVSSGFQDVTTFFSFCRVNKSGYFLRAFDTAGAYIISP